MRLRLLGLTALVALALASHLVTKALPGQELRRPRQTRSQAAPIKRQSDVATTQVSAHRPLILTEQYNDSCSHARIAGFRVGNNAPGVANFVLNVEAWQGAEHRGVGGDFVAQVDFYPVDNEDGNLGRLATVHSRPLGTVRGKLWRQEIPLSLSMPPGVYKARLKLVGMNAEWIRRPDSDPVLELPVHSLRTTILTVQ